MARVQAAFPTALLVHRLDRDTSGVMVFALTKSAQRHLGLQFEKRHTKKTYMAVVKGEVEGKTGEIHLPLIVDWPNRPLQHVNFEHGKQSITQWRRGAVCDGPPACACSRKRGDRTSFGCICRLWATRF